MTSATAVTYIQVDEDHIKGLYAEIARLRASQAALMAACQLVLDEGQDVLYTARMEEVTKAVKAALAQAKGE